VSTLYHASVGRLLIQENYIQYCIFQNKKNVFYFDPNYDFVSRGPRRQLDWATHRRIMVYITMILWRNIEYCVDLG